VQRDDGGDGADDAFGIMSTRHAASRALDLQEAAAMRA
jgi:hypothetical protein